MVHPTRMRIILGVVWLKCSFRICINLLVTREKKSVFLVEISPKNRLSAGTEEILATDNRLRKKSVENR